jgi:tungstate transport system ATP-binding protein
MRDERMRDRPTTLPITFENVVFAAGGQTIVSGVSFAIEAGPPTLLVGPNGAGKTTLIKLAMGLLTPSAGRVLPAQPAACPRSAIVFQKPVMLRRSVLNNVMFALTAAGRQADAKAALGWLERVGLGALADRPARRLSGGEQQRLALARALARDPAVLFLDEPTASLDPAATKAVEDIIGAAAAGGVKIVMATHDLGQARRLAGDIIFLVAGLVVERASAAQFFAAPGTEQARSFLAGDLVI